MPAAGLGFFMGLQRAQHGEAAADFPSSDDDDGAVHHAPELQQDTIMLPARHIAILDEMKAEHDSLLMVASGVDPLLLDPDADWMSTAPVQHALQAASEKEKQLPGTQKQLLQTYAAVAVIRETAITLHQYGIR